MMDLDFIGGSSVQAMISFRYEKQTSGDWKLISLDVDPKLIFVAVGAGLSLNSTVPNYVPTLVAVQNILQEAKLDGGSETTVMGEGMYEYTCAVVKRSGPHSR